MTTTTTKQEARKPVTFDDLRRRSTIKKRYGRSGLTIRRWGGFGRLNEENELADAIRGYLDGSVSAEDVAWAFIRSRVAAHSPTFKWEDAELERLLVLVAECSESPVFESREPEGIADELVKAQDAEFEQLKELTLSIGNQFRRSLTGVDALSRSLATSPLHEFAVGQARALDSIKKALEVRPLSMKSLIGDIGATASLKALARVDVPRFEFPVVGVGLKRELLGPGFDELATTRGSLRLANLVFPDSSFKQLSRSIESIQRSTRVELPSSLLAQIAATPLAMPLAGRSGFGVGAVFEAAHAAATQVERAGGHEEAAVLEAVTVEAEAVAEAPSLEQLERLIDELGTRLEAGFSQQRELSEEQEERRQRDRDEDRRRDLVLWFMALYVSFYIALYFHLIELARGR